MKELFFGSIASHEACIRMENPTSTLLYFNALARSHLPYENSHNYLKALEEDMQKKYNLPFKISFFDMDYRETVEDISGFCGFQLHIDLDRNPYYSKALH